MERPALLGLWREHRRARLISLILESYSPVEALKVSTRFETIKIPYHALLRGME